MSEKANVDQIVNALRANVNRNDVSVQQLGGIIELIRFLLDNREAIMDLIEAIKEIIGLFDGQDVGTPVEIPESPEGDGDDESE